MEKYNAYNKVLNWYDLADKGGAPGGNANACKPGVERDKGAGTGCGGGGGAAPTSTEPKKVTDKEVADLQERAQESGQEVDDLAQSYADQYGGTKMDINYKKADSIARKANTEEDGDITKIKDAVRTTVIVPDGKPIEDVYSDLSNDPNFERVKLQTPDNFYGYSGIVANVKTKNGLLAEIQFNTPSMIYAKQGEEDAVRAIGKPKYDEIKSTTGLEGGLGHDYYGIIRAEIPPSTQAARAIGVDNSINYYQNFS